MLWVKHRYFFTGHVRECQFLTAAVLIERHRPVAVEDKAAVTEGLLYTPSQCAAFERTPPAEALHIVCRHRKGLVADNGQVGFIALTDISPSFDAEERCRMMTH